MSVRSDLKKRLQAGQTIVAPGAYDPISARLIQSLGFDTIYTGGYMSGANLAVTEPLMTMTEQVEVGPGWPGRCPCRLSATPTPVTESRSTPCTASELSRLRE